MLFKKEADRLSKQTFKPGGFLSGQVFTLDDQLFSYKNAYGKYATVPRKSIQTVVIDAKGRGHSTLKLIGAGTELAKIDLPNSWARKTMEWLIKELNI
jgi:hypothetical protein